VASEGHSAAAAAAAAGFGGIPGVEGGAEDFVEGLGAGPEFRSIGLAYEDGASLADAFDEERVLFRGEVLKDTGAEGGAEAFGGLEVFVRGGKAVE
jgi:hypothetical protein